MLVLIFFAHVLQCIVNFVNKLFFQLTFFEPVTYVGHTLNTVFSIRGSNRQISYIEIGWVIVIWYVKALTFKKVDCVRQRAYVGQSSFGQQAQLVESLEDLARRLMYGAHNGLAHVRQTLHRVDYTHCHERVQTWCRLITEQYHGVGEDFAGECQAPLFATTDTFLVRDRYWRVSTLL